MWTLRFCQRHTQTRGMLHYQYYDLWGPSRVYIECLLWKVLVICWLQLMSFQGGFGHSSWSRKVMSILFQGAKDFDWDAYNEADTMKPSCCKHKTNEINIKMGILSKIRKGTIAPSLIRNTKQKVSWQSKIQKKLTSSPVLRTL